MRRWILVVACGLIGHVRSFAFVTLNTSGPEADVIDSLSPPATPESSSAATAPSAPRPLGSALFVAGSDQRVYAAWGLLEAMQEFHLRPDAVVAEGTAALPAAVFVLGYRMSYLDSLPEAVWDGGGDRADRPAIPAALDPRWNAADPLPWSWNPTAHRAALPDWLLPETPVAECGVDPKFSWRIAQLVRAAPDTAAARNHGATRLAFQMTATRSGSLQWVENGSLQTLIAASLFPAEVGAVCEPAPEWISGAVVSAGRPLAAVWPAAPKHLVYLQMPGSAAPQPLVPASPLDSLRRTWNRGDPDPDQVPPGTDLIPITLERESDLPPDDSAAAWIQMGYRAGLRSIDVLRRVFRTDTSEFRAPPPPKSDRKLWMDAALNPIGESNLQLLRQRLRYLPTSGAPEDWIPALFGGGFYSDVNVEWIPPARPWDEEGLQITAAEHSNFGAQGGAAFQTLGQPLFRRAPEAFGEATWAEPYYLPYQLEAAAALGGIHPGMGIRLALEPAWIWWLRFSAYEMFDENNFDVPTSDWNDAGAQSLFLREQEGGLRASIGFSPRQCFTFGVRHRTLQDLDPPAGIEDAGYESVDFTAALLLQTSAANAAWRGKLRLETAYRDPVALPGVVREAYASDRGAFEIIWKGLEAAGQGQYTDTPDPLDPDRYDQWTMASVLPLSFGDQVWLPDWRHRRYGAMSGGIHTALGLLSVRAVAGGTLYQQREWDGSEHHAEKPYWETDLSLPGFLGPWRAAAGGFDHYGPFFMLQWGANFDLHRVFRDPD